MTRTVVDNVSKVNLTLRFTPKYKADEEQIQPTQAFSIKPNKAQFAVCEQTLPPDL